MPKTDQPLMPNLHPDDPSLSDYPWFVNRMTTDTWFFGLLLTTGVVAVITRIIDIREHGGIVWIDVEMAEDMSVSGLEHLQLLVAPTSRCVASVRADAIVAAFELADT